MRSTVWPRRPVRWCTRSASSPTWCTCWATVASREWAENARTRRIVVSRSSPSSSARSSSPACRDDERDRSVSSRMRPTSAGSSGPSWRASDCSRRSPRRRMSARRAAWGFTTARGSGDESASSRSDSFRPRAVTGPPDVHHASVHLAQASWWTCHTCMTI